MDNIQMDELNEGEGSSISSEASEHSDSNKCLKNLEETQSKENEARTPTVKRSANDNDQSNVDELNKKKKMRVLSISNCEEDQQLTSCDGSSSVESPSVQDKVFGNPLLLVKIFKSFTKTDLLKCRLVKMRPWNEVATTILRIKRMCRINFEYDPTRGKFELARLESDRFNYSRDIHENNTPVNRPLLSSLTKCIRKSKGFPCVKFGFWDGFICNKEKSKDFQSFISYYGNQLRELEVDLYCKDDNVTLTPFRRLLLTQAHNIDLLHIPNFDGWNGQSTTSFLGPSSNPRFQLPNLKCLLNGQGVDWNSTVMQHITEAAPNIKAFKSISNNFHIDDLSTYAEFNKMDTIRHLRLMDDQLEAQEEFAEMNHPVCSVGFFLNSSLYGEPLEIQSRFSAAWVKILRASSSKLTKISRLECVGYLPEFGSNFPPLPLVEKIVLSAKDHFYGVDDILYGLRAADTRAWSIIPTGSQFSTAFPNLNHVILDWTHMHANAPHMYNEWDRFFPAELNPAPSVTRLDLPCVCPLDWFSRLAQFFPCVESLKVGLTYNFPSVAQAIWTHFNKLTALDVSICVSGKAHPENTRVKLDVAFTGLSEKACQKLKEQERNKNETTTITSADLLRVNPSIRDLKSLKKLRIEFRDHGFNNFQSWDHLSNVSLSFALKEMCEEGELKDFTVKIIVDHYKCVKRDLDNLAKYAKIEVKKLDRSLHSLYYGC